MNTGELEGRESGFEKKEKKPIISMVPVYPAIPFGTPVEKEILQEASNIAISLMLWTLEGGPGSFFRLLDYIKITFAKGHKEAEIVVTFKLTLRLLSTDPDKTLTVPWHKIPRERHSVEGIFELPLDKGHDDFNKRSTEDVIAAIKISLYRLLTEKRAVKISEGEYLKKISEAIQKDVKR